MRKRYSSVLLTLLVVFTQFVLVGQSRKKFNNQLILQHDSLVLVIQQNQQRVESTTILVQNFNDSLLASFVNFRTPSAIDDFTDFIGFYDKIEFVKEAFFDESTNYLEELKKRYDLLNETEFSDYLTQITTIETLKRNYTNLILTQKYQLGKLIPNLKLASKERNKERWNNRIFSQNQSLNYFIELQETYIKNQTALANRLKKEVQENLVLYQDFSQLMNQTKNEDEKLTIETLKWSKVKEKREAESARKDAIYWKKNKGKTIEFIPPAVTDNANESNPDYEQKGVDEEQEQKLKVELKLEKREEEIFTIVDEPAEFPGGNNAFKKYLNDNLKYPESAREFAMEGKVYVKFIVSKNGDISNVTVLSGIPNCNECDKEAVRLIKSMPKWKASKFNGNEVNSTYTFPVSFKIK